MACTHNEHILPKPQEKKSLDNIKRHSKWNNSVPFIRHKWESKIIWFSYFFLTVEYVKDKTTISWFWPTDTIAIFNIFNGIQMTDRN